MPRIKIKDMENHARKRLAERYGIRLTQRLFQEIKNNLKFSKVIVSQSNRVTIRDLELNIRPEEWIDSKNIKPKQKLRFAWDKNRQCIATFLDLNMSGFSITDFDG